MSHQAIDRYVAALTKGDGLHDDFIYSMSWEDYTNFPDPFARMVFAVEEVEARIGRYPNPAKPGELFQWDIHGRLFTPVRNSITDMAVVMVHGGAANEYEFIFTPDGPEEYPDLSKTDPAKARAGVAQHIASLGIPVLAISLPGHYSRKPWPPIPERRPEFIIGEVPGDEELKSRLAVYTFRMCLEAIKVLIEKSLPDCPVFCWGHSTGGEYFYLLEQYGIKNKLIGGLGFGTGMPAWVRKEWDLACAEGSPEERAAGFRNITDLSRRSAKGYVKSGYVGPNQLGAAQSAGSNWRITAARSLNHFCKTSSTAPTTCCCRRSKEFPNYPATNSSSPIEPSWSGCAARNCSTSSANTTGATGSKAERRVWNTGARYTRSSGSSHMPRR